MKIKDYLDILDRLPQTPYKENRVQFAYNNSYNANLINSDIISFKHIDFYQESYRDNMNRIKYRWKELNPVQIDYGVDDIYITTTNDIVMATIIDLAYKYKFKHWTTMTSNKKSCYINFRLKYWSLSDSRVDKFYFVGDDKIIENIFVSSIGEYPNGIPIVWED